MVVDSAQIRCFIELSRSLNFTKAADAVYLSQPAFSRKIAALEQEIGAVLIERDSKEVRITREGQIFLECAYQVEKLLNDCAERIGDLEKDITGRLKLGILQDALEVDLMEFAGDFENRHPGIEVQIVSTSCNDMKKMLEKGNLDIGFMNSWDESFLMRMNSVPIENSLEYILTSKKHPLANRDYVDLEDLVDERFIVLDQCISPNASVLEEEFARIGKTVNICGTETLTFGIMNAVASGKGIGFLCEKTSTVARTGLRCIPIRNGLPVTHRAIWARNNKSECLELFVNELKEHWPLAARGE